MKKKLDEQEDRNNREMKRMVTLFEVCFYLGVILTVLFFVLGHISDFMNIDGVDMDFDVDMDLDLDFDADLDLDFDAEGIDLDSGDLSADSSGFESAADAGGGGSLGFLLGWLKPNLIILFCTLFGGFGLIFTDKRLPMPLVLVLSILIGWIGVYIINRFLIRLLKNESTTVASQTELIGHLGKAALKMEGEQVGAIVYVINGNTYQSPAKSFEKYLIQRGEDIIIIDIKDNLFYVKKF